MKNLLESLLDDEDVIMDKADKDAELAASAAWLKDHGVGMSLEPVVRDVVRNPGVYNYSKVYSDGVWHLRSEIITVTEKDKEIPSFVHFDNTSIVFSKWKGTELPDMTDIPMLQVRIAKCPNLKSLKGCPESVTNFSVTDCPKIDKLDGCPKVVLGVFKVLNCAKRFTAKDIRRACLTDKKTMIY